VKSSLSSPRKTPRTTPQKTTPNPAPESVPLLDLRRQYDGIREEVLAAIARACDSQSFILGPEVEALEREIAALTGAACAVGCASGTEVDTLRHGNPRNRDTSHLKRGGRKPRTILSIPELEFACWLAHGVSVADAARWASVTVANIYALARTPRVRAERDRLIKKYTEESEDRVMAMREKLGTFVLGEYQHRTRTAVTHLDRGDQDVRNLLRDGMEAVGLVQPKGTPINVSAQAGAVAGAPAATAFQVYESQWMIENKRKMSAQLATPHTHHQSPIQRPLSDE
jgi:DegT/DnrJ/EryC1/StrS aminotransferase family